MNKGRNFLFGGRATQIPACDAPPSPPPLPPSPPSPPSPPPPPPLPPLATNVACLPDKQNEALLDFSGAKPQRFLHCAHPPPAERARIVPVPQGRTCCTTTWAALPVTTVRRQVKIARQRCHSSATSAPIQDAPVRPWTTRATTELVRWPRTSAVPAGTGLPQRPPRRASSCAVFGDVFKDGTTSWFTGSDTAIDMYIENTTYYYNCDGGNHHNQNQINGQFAQINLDGPNNDKRGTADSNTDIRHETTFRFKFVRRDTGQPVAIPWMQFTFFDFDENVLTDWLVREKNAVAGDGREARPAPH